LERLHQSTSDEAAVVFFIFRRPDLTERVFKEIRNARPKKLYVIADGPRNLSEVAEVSITRDCVKDIDWECEVVRIYQEENLGLRESVIRGLDIVFEREARAIILEDDCLPSPSFFRFCNELLEKYKSEETVSMVSGFSDGATSKTNNQYFFSLMPEIWGWATWSEVWKEYRRNEILRVWDKKQQRQIVRTLGRLTRGRFFGRLLKNNIQLKTWDVEFAAYLILRNKLVAVPKANLIRNIGFGGHATHTKIRPPGLNNSLGNFTFPISHPNKLAPETFQTFRQAAVRSARLTFGFFLSPFILLNYFLMAIRTRFGSKIN